jgi:hypothetical protein
MPDTATTHFVMLAQGILYRGAGDDVARALEIVHDRHDAPLPALRRAP